MALTPRQRSHQNLKEREEDPKFHRGCNKKDCPYWEKGSENPAGTKNCSVEKIGEEIPDDAQCREEAR